MERDVFNCSLQAELYDARARSGRKKCCFLLLFFVVVVEMVDWFMLLEGLVKRLAVEGVPCLTARIYQDERSIAEYSTHLNQCRWVFRQDALR